MNKRLCIGGNHDGRWTDRAGDYVMIPRIIPEPILVSFDTLAAGSATFVRDTYHREVITFPDKSEIEFLIVEGMSPAEAFNRLLAGYKP